MRYLFLLLIALFTQCTPSTTSEAPRPNIIILFCDDLGYGDLTCYGHPTIRTPHLDQMAQKGMKFTNFYAGSPACTASRYALLTGRYPVRSGLEWVLFPHSQLGMHPKEKTLAEGLKEAGYATACIGKWHLGVTKADYLPLQNGFDTYLGLPYSNDMLPPRYAPIPLIQGNDTIESGPDQTTLTKRYTEAAIDFVQQHPSDPFFLYFPYAMPHVPLNPGEAFAGKSERGKYGDVVEEIDWSVGQIIDAVAEMGLAENTLIFFTSDNGPWLTQGANGGSSGLLRDGKGSTWEGGMREPGIAYWPGQVPANSVCTSITSTLDLYTTCLSLAGKEAPDDRTVDGRDISSLFLDDKRALSDSPYFYYGPDNRLQAVRHGKWKLHIRTNSQLQVEYFDKKLPLLFDLDTDPSEKYDLSEDFPEIVAQLQSTLVYHRDQVAQEGTFWDETRE